jgi:hypothetical protein
MPHRQRAKPITGADAANALCGKTRLFPIFHWQKMKTHGTAFALPIENLREQAPGQE